MHGASVDVITSEYHCTVCGQAFIPRAVTHKLTCGARKCRRRAAYAAERARPQHAEANRRRCAAWYQANKARHLANVAKRKHPLAPVSSGAAGRFFITPHAVMRYSERVGALTYEAALAALIDETARAHFVKRLATGAELWRGPSPRRLRFIVGPGRGEKPALVTVERAGRDC